MIPKSEKKELKSLQKYNNQHSPLMLQLPPTHVTPSFLWIVAPWLEAMPWLEDQLASYE